MNAIKFQTADTLALEASNLEMNTKATILVAGVKCEIYVPCRITLYVTDYCDFACPCCHTGMNARTSGIILMNDPDVYVNLLNPILDDLEPYKDLVEFTITGGEPGAVPEVTLAVLDLLHKRNFKLHSYFTMGLNYESILPKVLEYGASNVTLNVPHHNSLSSYGHFFYLLPFDHRISQAQMKQQDLDRYQKYHSVYIPKIAKFCHANDMNLKATAIVFPPKLHVDRSGVRVALLDNAVDIEEYVHEFYFRHHITKFLFRPEASSIEANFEAVKLMNEVINHMKLEYIGLMENQVYRVFHYYYSKYNMIVKLYVDRQDKPAKLYSNIDIRLHQNSNDTKGILLVPRI